MKAYVLKKGAEVIAVVLDDAVRAEEELRRMSNQEYYSLSELEGTVYASREASKWWATCVSVIEKER